MVLAVFEDHHGLANGLRRFTGTDDITELEGDQRVALVGSSGDVSGSLGRAFIPRSCGVSNSPVDTSDSP